MKMAANNDEENIISHKTRKALFIIAAIIILMTIGCCVFITRYTTFFNDLLQKQEPMQLHRHDANAAETGTAVRLVCYFNYFDPNNNKSVASRLNLTQVDPELCTHINVGVADIQNSSIRLAENLEWTLREEVPQMRLKNPNLKFLLWIGGGGIAVKDFSIMVSNHTNRKIFIKSMKTILRNYSLDGIDLDWEFPSSYNKERMHFSQLLYEIKQEFRREKRDYLLSIAVAAVEGIAVFAYDIREINLHADYVNLMSYDYHFYTRGTPFTGLNAPLYARPNEDFLLGTLNINYSISWWLSNGLDPKKLVVGLPTYGHSFTLVNPFNNKIGAPASGFGNCGVEGFTTYSDICKFSKSNLVSVTFDNETHSPYLTSRFEWISFENAESIAAKTLFIKSKNLGGVMVFSLNTDDVWNVCKANETNDEENGPSASSPRFPLIETIKKILFNQELK